MSGTPHRDDRKTAKPSLGSWAYWRRKFLCAFRGIGLAVREGSSYRVHLPMAVLVIVLATALQLDRVQLQVLLLAIAAVLAAEMFNSTLERLASILTSEHDPRIRDALDVASGAVLVMAIGAAAAGLLALAPELWAALTGSVKNS